MNLIHQIKLYLPFTLNTFQRKLDYIANAIIFILGEGLMLVVSYYLWKVIYLSSSESIINGFNFHEMVIYVLMSSLTALIISSEVSHEISSEVKNSSIAINLIRL